MSMGVAGMSAAQEWDSPLKIFSPFAGLGGLVLSALALMHLQAAGGYSIRVIIGEALLASAGAVFIVSVVFNAAPVGNLLDALLLVLWSFGGASLLSRPRATGEKGESAPMKSRRPLLLPGH